MSSSKQDGTINKTDNFAEIKDLMIDAAKFNKEIKNCQVWTTANITAIIPLSWENFQDPKVNASAKLYEITGICKGHMGIVKGENNKSVIIHLDTGLMVLSLDSVGAAKQKADKYSTIFKEFSSKESDVDFDTVNKVVNMAISLDKDRKLVLN